MKEKERKGKERKGKERKGRRAGAVFQAPKSVRAMTEPTWVVMVRYLL